MKHTHYLNTMTNLDFTKFASRDTWMTGGPTGLEDVTITLEDNGDTLLTGPVIDQAALHGLLKRVRDLGMPLLSVNFVHPGQARTQEVKS